MSLALEGIRVVDVSGRVIISAPGEPGGI